jgi:hypothetical protein
VREPLGAVEDRPPPHAVGQQRRSTLLKKGAGVVSASVFHERLIQSESERETVLGGTVSARVSGGAKRVTSPCLGAS